MKKRYLILASDSILLIFLGLVYGWSVFKKPLEAAYGWNDSQLTWTFTICMFMFCIGGFLGAELSKKISHKILTIISSFAIGLSFVLMGFMTSLWQIYVLYGVVVGFVVGLVYNCVLATGNKWFPDKGGFIAGLLLMFFGAGSLFLSPLSNFLIAKYGLKIAFIIIGAMFLLVLLGTAFQVVAPKENELGDIKSAAQAKQYIDVETRDMIKSRNFWIYFFWCVIVSSIGLALLGQIATISGSVGLDSGKSALMVSLFAVFNGLGRFFFGGFYDKYGRLPTMTIFGLFFSIASIVLWIGVTNLSSVLIIISFVFYGLAYGGVTPTNANFARSYFGNKNYATNFSIVNFNLLLSVFFSQYIGSTLYMKTGGFAATAIALTVLSVISLIMQFFITKQKV